MRSISKRPCRAFLCILMAGLIFLSAVVFLSSDTAAYGSNDTAGFNIGAGGSWWDNRQCTRISVFSLALGECVASCDFFYDYKRINSDNTWCNGSLVTLKADIDDAVKNRYDIKIGSGCKLDYLLEYEENGKCIADIEINAFDHRSFIEQRCVWIDSNNATIYRLITPLCYIGRDSSGGYLYDDSASLSSFLKQVHNDKQSGAKFNYMINSLGFYFGNGTSSQGAAYTYLDSDYILVLEPVYWFTNYYRDDGVDEFFYGTATEWANIDTAE